MRGGKRLGAGRKPGEPTKMIRVPVALIPEVQALIAQRRSDLNSETENKPAIVEAPLIHESENKSAKLEAPLNNDSAIKAARKALERLSIHDRKLLEKSFGSLTNAAKLGVRACGRDFSVPDEIKHRVKLPADRVV